MLRHALIHATRLPRRRLLMPIAIAATTVALAACGTSTTSGADPTDSGAAMSGMNESQMAAMPGADSTGAVTEPHNDADIAFATQMIPHHEQAVAMADLAPSRAESAAVKDLAAQIKAAQGPEIKTMTGWLSVWGTPTATAMDDSNAMEGMAGMDHSGSGMMSDDDMSALGVASGTTFDRMWLTMMISHHEGAVTMATTETAEGTNQAAIDLADGIVTSQTAEIDTMTTLLDTLPSS